MTVTKFGSVSGPPMLGTMRAAYQLRHRMIVDPMEHVAKFLSVGDPMGEMLPVGLAQRANQCIAVLAGDRAVLIAVALIKARLLHEGNPPKFPFVGGECPNS
jgi:hypothetical protein